MDINSAAQRKVFRPYFQDCTFFLNYLLCTQLLLYSMEGILWRLNRTRVESETSTPALLVTSLVTRPDPHLDTVPHVSLTQEKV